MTPARLQQLIASGEGQTVEFKDERIKPSDLAETLVALANADGGTVVIGVSDDLSIKGVTDLKLAGDNALIAASRECSDPPVEITSVRRVPTEDGKTLIVIRVPKSHRSVHSAQGRFFTREGSRNVALTSDALRQLIASRHDPDSLPVATSAKRPGMLHSPVYELLRRQISLTLLDRKGHEAVVEKRQRVRFLQDNVIALFDRSWGEGKIFAGYRVSQGRVADRFRAGSRFHTLISLRDTKHRGDTLSYRIRQRMVDGFTGANEWYEVDIDHPTKHLTVTVNFPKDRPCQSAFLIEASTGKRTTLPVGSLRTLPSGQQVLTWSINKPVLGERYAIHWSW